MRLASRYSRKTIARQRTKAIYGSAAADPPDKPVVLVDYSPSRSGETAYSLLDDFTGYLVCDAYPGYNKAIERNELKPVFCASGPRKKDLLN